jgi:hypothetical protein
VTREVAGSKERVVELEIEISQLDVAQREFTKIMERTEEELKEKIEVIDQVSR